MAVMPMTGSCTCSGWAAKARAGRLQRAGPAPSASLRVPCDARSPGPPPNSLHSLRSLRSDKGRQVRARVALRARARSPVLLGASMRTAACPPAPLWAPQGFALQANCQPRAVSRFGNASHHRNAEGACGRPVARIEAPRSTGLAALARSATREHSCRPLSERSGRRTRSELGGGPQDRASQGTRSEAEGAGSARHRPPARAFSLPGRRQSGLRRQRRHATRASIPGTDLHAVPLLELRQLPADRRERSGELRRRRALRCRSPSCRSPAGRCRSRRSSPRPMTAAWPWR